MAEHEVENAQRVIVLARNQADAHAWCSTSGVRPFARTTIIATRGPRLRGLTLLPTDRVVDLGGATAEVYDDLALLRHIADVISRPGSEADRG